MDAWNSLPSSANMCFFPENEIKVSKVEEGGSICSIDEERIEIRNHPLEYRQATIVGELTMFWFPLRETISGKKCFVVVLQAWTTVIPIPEDRLSPQGKKEAEKKKSFAQSFKKGFELRKNSKPG